MVGIHKVLHYNVMEDLTLLLYHLIEHVVCTAAKEEECYDAKVAECALIAPCFPNRLPSIKLLVCCANEDHQERHVGLTFLGLVNDEIKCVGV